MDYETVWHGYDPLGPSLERDYVAMRGDDWDLIWVPPSPLTTMWSLFFLLAWPDPNQHVASHWEAPV